MKQNEEEEKINKRKQPNNATKIYTAATNLDGTKLKSINFTAKWLLCVQFSCVSDVCTTFDS